MKEKLALVLILIVLCNALFPAGGLSELCKLPKLLQHYSKHHAPGEQKVSISQFLLDHYTPSDHQHEHDHSDLPVLGCINILWYVSFQSICLGDCVQESTIEKYSDCYSASKYLSPTLSILQPPRIRLA